MLVKLILLQRLFWFKYINVFVCPTELESKLKC